MSSSSSGTLGLTAITIPSYPLLFNFTIEVFTSGKRCKAKSRITFKLNIVITQTTINLTERKGEYLYICLTQEFESRQKYLHKYGIVKYYSFLVNFLILLILKTLLLSDSGLIFKTLIILSKTAKSLYIH